MATMSGWRDTTHFTVDLTMNSDDDDDARPGSLLDSPSTVSRPRKTPIPLPKNVQHLYSSPASPMPSTAKYIPPPKPGSKKSTIPVPQSVRVNATTPSSSVRANDSTPPSYVGISNTRNGQQNAIPEKRRKLSMGGKRRPGGIPDKTEELRKNVEMAGKSTSNTAMKYSVHSLNSALKSNATRLSIPSGMFNEEPRALKIGRAPVGDGGKIPEMFSEEPRTLKIHRVSAGDDGNTTSSFSRSSARPLQHVPVTAPVPISTETETSELELLSSDPEMEKDAEWRRHQDVDLGIDSSQQQVPLRKSQRKLRSDNGYRFKRPKGSLKSINPPPSPSIDQAHDDDNDSVIGPSPMDLDDSSNNRKPLAIPPISLPRQVPPVRKSISSIATEPAYSLKPNSKMTENGWSEEEDHLLLFLKEVKQKRWVEIEPELPHRTPNSIQTRYSSKIKRRTHDPPRLNLPARYAHEAVVDWRAVRAKVESAATGPTSRPPAERLGVASTRALRCRNSNEHNQSSTSESISAVPSRPRRSVKTVDYTLPWPRNRTELNFLLDENEMDFTSREASEPLRRSTEPLEQSSGPETAVPADQKLDVNFEQQDSSLVLSGHKPFLSVAQRSQIRCVSEHGEWDVILGRDWQGSLVHVDFSLEELSIAEKIMTRNIPLSRMTPFQCPRRRIQSLLKGQTEPKLLMLTEKLRRQLPGRDRSSIAAFLQDAQAGKLRINSRIDRIGAVRQDTSYRSNYTASTSSLVRQRELGLQSRRGWKSASTGLAYQTKNSVFDTLGPAISYTGASYDVHTVAWSPSGESFAAGTVCITDDFSMQYNRPNNLLYGDLSRTAIHELGAHHIPRQMAKEGPNSTHAMRVTQDDRLFTTVSSVAFSPDGQFMFSAGYDKMVCVWSLPTDGSQPDLEHQFAHKAEVDVMAVSRHGVLATGSKRLAGSQFGDKNAPVKVISNVGLDAPAQHSSFGSQKATIRPDDKFLPTALKFEPNDGRYLLAGFGANKREDRMDLYGDICLWDISTSEEITITASTRNVFDLAWNPIATSQPRFAVGCVAKSNVNRNTRSTVRLYDLRDGFKFGMIMETECPALDMNDVTFCPYDENVIAVGCTDGKVYVWDLRNPDDVQYTLSHGMPLNPLEAHSNREMTDTGVRFLSWGENATRLYSGSSDGVVKIWDVVRSPEDVFVKNLITADSGIMSGAFSPDMSKLVLGEVNGSVSVLEVGRADCVWKDMDRFKYVSYDDGDPESQSDDDEAKAFSIPPGPSATIASDYINSGQIITVPFGNIPIRQAVQGPNYQGPYDNGVDAPCLRELALQFQLSHAQTADSDPQCSLASCVDNIVKATSEDIGDSGRSVDRIPDQLREHWKVPGSDRISVPGKARCTGCGRPARPLGFADDIGKPVLCETCSFACFRCGAHNKIDTGTASMTCASCKRQWDIGILGYECIKENSDHPGIDTGTKVPHLKGYDRDLFAARMDEWDDVSFGDEMNALTDYYFSLAIDRPESPPL